MSSTNNSERNPPLEAPLVPDSEFNDTDVNHKIIFNFVIPFTCFIIVCLMSVLSIIKKTPIFLFFTLILLWLLVIYPIYY